MLVLEAIGNLGADAIIKDLNGQKYIAFSVAQTVVNYRAKQEVETKK